MLRKRFIVMGGKGGVGRTTVSVALALALARQGRRVLLAHVRTKQRVGRMLGAEEPGEEIREVAPNLWAVNMNPRAALRERGMMVLRFKAVYRAVMENRLVKYFLRAIPALDEYSMLGKAWFHTTEMLDGQPKYDAVIFDGPATGHMIPMLRIPQVILDVVPEGPLTEDARKIYEMLIDPMRTAMWIVTLAEEMAVSEALDLYAAATEDLKISVQRVVVNGLYPDTLERAPELDHALEQLCAAATPAWLGPLLAAAQTMRGRRRINRMQLDRVARELPLPRVELPYLFTAEFDRSSLEQLSEPLDACVRPSSGLVGEVGHYW